MFGAVKYVHDEVQLYVGVLEDILFRVLLFCCPRTGATLRTHPNMTTVGYVHQSYDGRVGPLSSRIVCFGFRRGSSKSTSP